MSDRVLFLKVFFLTLFYALGFFGCQLLPKSSGFKNFPVKTKAKKTKAKEKRTWQEIKSQKNKTLKERIKDIEVFIQDNKDKNVALEAYLLKARLYSKNKQNKKACESYHQLVQSPFNYIGQWEAYRKSAGCYFKEDLIEPAVEALEAFIQNPDESPADKKKAARLQWRFLKNKQGFVRWKLISLSHLSLFSSQPKDKEFWQAKGKALVRSLSPDDLVLYAGQASFYGVFEGHLLYRAGAYFFKNRELKQSKDYFKKALSSPLPLNMKKDVKNRLALIKKISKVNPYRIGVLVPLSGRRKAFGEKILRGVYMGLDLEKDSPWQVLVMDSKSHPDVVRTQLDNLFYEHHVIALIGGLTSETAEVIAQKAEDFATPAVLLSQKQDLNLNRDFVFQNAVTAKQLLNPLVQYIRRNLKVHQAAILYPDDSYGTEYARLFSQIFKEEGGKIEGYEMYKTGEVDFKKSIKNLLQLSLKTREEEFEKLKQKFLKENPSLSARSRKLTPENLLPAKMEFQAVFIPDSMEQLKRIRDHLKYFGVKDIYLLGTNIWRPRQIPRWTEDLPLLFMGLLDRGRSTIQKSLFYKDFLRTYAQPPGLFEQRAYNSAVFLKQALSKGARSRLTLQQELQRIKKFQGAYYEIPVLENQVFQYPLSIYKKGFGKGHKLDSVPVK